MTCTVQAERGKRNWYKGILRFVIGEIVDEYKNDLEISIGRKYGQWQARLEVKTVYKESV